jgi:hypothetical protein
MKGRFTDGTSGVIRPNDVELKNADARARDFRENNEWAYRSYIRGTTQAGQNCCEPANGRSQEPLTITDLDPAALAPEGDINYEVHRKSETSAPGIVNPNEPVGVDKGEQKTPPRITRSPSGTGPGNAEGPPSKEAGGDHQSAPRPAPEYFNPGDLFAGHGPGKSEKGNGDNSKADPADDSGKVHEKATDGNIGPKGKKTPQQIEAEEGFGGEKDKELKKGDKEPAPGQAPRKIIIRSGDMDFEVDSFDAAVVVITRLVIQIKGGYVDTVNSKMLDNGKVRGSVVVRVPPDKLDQLILDLRKDLGKFGELKGQRIASLDITKKYTDMESRLRGARTMEERFLKIIRDGKGEIKDLIAAEKELGVWRLIIEEMEGELRYWSNQAALSTLTINVAEKEIQRAAFVTECERVQAGLEVEDVDKALRDAQKAVAEAQGRVTRSEMKQHAAGQYSALLDFEVDPDAAGPLRDRLRQLGTMVRLEINRVQEPEGGGTVPKKDRKVKRGPTQFFVSLINLANIDPREKVTLKVAANDVSASFNKLRAAAVKVKARVAVSQLNEQDPKNVKGQLDFDVRRVDEPAIQAALVDAGAILSRKVDRAPEGVNVTDAKVGFKVELVAAASLAPRETTTLKLAAPDVAGTFRKLRETVKKAKGRFMTEQLNEQDRRNPTAQLDFEIRQADEGPIQADVVASGAVLSRKVDRSPEGDVIPDPRVAFKLELVPATNIAPRELFTLAVEVNDPDATMAMFTSQVKDAGGRVLRPARTQEPDGRITTHAYFDVPLASGGGLFEKFKASGIVRVQDLKTSASAPDGKFALGRLDVTVSNPAPLVGQDEGVWGQIRKGLGTSLAALALSLRFLIVGVLVVLPWLLLLAAFAWLVRWVFLGREGAAVPATATTGPAGGGSTATSG